MANLATGFGAALLLLGIGGYVLTGMESPTALIPAAFGIILLLCGVLARDPAKRKLMMHIAAAVGVLGFLGSVRGLMVFGRMLAGETVPRPSAATAQAIMAILTLSFTILCVRSFVNARRSRSVETL
jgi:hypothetical protein